MSDTFRPGDRVSISGGPELIVVVHPHCIGADSPALRVHGQLVSRPVYPEPGQVVVTLDEREQGVILNAETCLLARGSAAEREVAGDLRAILDRARGGIIRG